MGGVRDDHVGTIDAPFLARLVPINQERIDDALGAAEAHCATRFVRWILLADLVAMHEGEGHRDDVRLEASHARADVSLKRVDVREERKDRVQEIVVLVIAAIHRSRTAAVFPCLVLRAGDGSKLLEDGIGRAALRREAADYSVALRVGVEASHQGFDLFAHDSLPLPTFSA